MEQKIRLVTAFKGVKFLPSLFALGHNNINPMLVLRENEIEFRNLFSAKKKGYEEIQEVGIYINTLKVLSVMTTNIMLTFENSVFTFAGNTNDLEELKKTVLIFQEKHCFLSEEAKRFIEK